MTKYSEGFQPLDHEFRPPVPPRPGCPPHHHHHHHHPPKPPCPPCPPHPPVGPGCDNPVFAGKKPLAYLDDLAALHGEVLRWLIGPNGEFSNNGYAPLNPSGLIDEKYFSQLGVDTYFEDRLVKDNATKYNFYGNFVNVSKETIQSLTDCNDGGNAYRPKEIVNVYIGSNKNASTIGTTDGITDGSIDLSFDAIDMIIPDASSSDYRKKVYGDWIPGTVVQGFNANKNSGSCISFDPIIASSVESIKFSNLETKFILTVYGPDGGAIAVSETCVISANNNNVPLIGANQNMRFEVSDFKEEGFVYSAKIRWIINIAGILGSYGGRFGLQITHVDGNNCSIWRSEDYFYNTGSAPIIGGLYEKIADQIGDDPSYKPVYLYASGLKYLTRGKINIGAYDIDRLNSNAAVADKASITSDFLDLDEYVYSDGDIGDYTLNVDLADARFLHTFDVKENILIFGPSYYEITFKNASGSTTTKKESHILINTLRNLDAPTKLVETFNDESHRCSVDFLTDETGVQFVKWNSTQSLETADNGRGLLVIPGFGLVYPTNVFDYSYYIPTPNPNYSALTGKRYFCRRFYNDATQKFGGTFLFDGITAEEFMQAGISCEISKNNGANWLTLKEYREGEFDNGILTNIEDTVSGCAVQFAFKENESVCGNIGLLFKLAFGPSVRSVIKRITLNNISNTGEW